MCIQRYRTWAIACAFLATGCQPSPSDADIRHAWSTYRNAHSSLDLFPETALQDSSCQYTGKEQSAAHVFTCTLTFLPESSRKAEAVAILTRAGNRGWIMLRYSILTS